MVQRPDEVRRRRYVAKRRRRLARSERGDSGMVTQMLARDELREIVRRLALGDRPGIALDPLPSRR